MPLYFPSPVSCARSSRPLLAMLLLCAPAAATPCGSCVDKVKVTITDGYLGEHYSLTFSSATGGSASFTGAHGSVQLVPDVLYTLTADTIPGAGFCTDENDDPYGENDCWHLAFNASCHQVEIDGTKTLYIDDYDDCTTTRSWSFMLRSPASSGPPGSSSGPSASGDGIQWTASAGGTLSDGSHAGAFVLRETGITADIFSPGSLLFQSTSSSVDLIDLGSGGHRQFVTPEGVFDIKALPQGQQGFELRFYPHQSVGGIVNGYHTFTGDPIVIHRIDNPDPGNLTSARFTEIRGVAQNVQVLTPTSLGDTGIWTTVEGDGLRRTTRARTPDGNELIEILTVETGDGQGGYTLESKTHTERHAFPWGWETVSTMRLVQAADGNDSEIWDHPTQHVYYGQDANHPAEEGAIEYGQIKWTINPDGSWVQYGYDEYSDSGPSYIRRPWLGSPESPDQATDNVGHVIKRQFGLNPWGASFYIYDFLTQETEHINGQEIRKTTWTANTTSYQFPAQMDVIRERQWHSSTEYHESETVRYTRKSEAYGTYGYRPRLSGRSYRITRQDGTRTQYNYTEGTYDPVSGDFTPAAGSPHLRVTETHTHKDITGPGLPYATTRRVTIEDASGLTLVSRQHVYAPDDSGGYTGEDDFPLISETHHIHDTARRLERIETDGRITHEQTWNGNRLTSTTDESGVTTTYSDFDALGRATVTTHAGLSITSTFDAAGRTLTTTQGTGSDTLTTSTSYDLLGRNRTHTDENGLTIHTAYAADPITGISTTTRTSPSGATTITTTHRDGQTASVTGTAVVPQFFTYEITSENQRHTTVHYGTAESPRWQATTLDRLGRTATVTRPGYDGTRTESHHYDDTSTGYGRHIRTTRTGFADQRTTYDALGRPTRHGIDHTESNSLVEASADTLTETAHFWEYTDDTWHEVRETREWLTDDDATATVTSRTSRQAGSLPAGTIAIHRHTNANEATTTVIETVDRAQAIHTRTVHAPHATQPAAAISVNGRLTSTTSHSIQQPVIHQHDALGRPWKTTDPRTGAITTTTYHPGTHQPATRTTPAGTTQYTWIPQGQPGAGQIQSETNGLGHSTHHAYNLRGQQTRTWGTATYPVETLYCPTFGERTGLRTFRDPAIDFTTATWPTDAEDPAAADLTQWHHQPATGLLTAKEYPNTTTTPSTTTQYTYNEKDLLHTRTWARSPVAQPGTPIITTHTYNGAGHHLTTTHSDGTPAVTRTLDRRGLPATITDAAGTRALEHNPSGQLTLETFTAGPLSNLLSSVSISSVSSQYDDHHRLQSIQIPGLLTHTHQYNPAHGRLETTTDGTYTVTTTYHPDSDLIHTHEFDKNTQTRLTTTRTFDAPNRLRTISSATSATTAAAFTYQYNAASHRTHATMEDGTTWHYGYNPRGEVTGAQRVLPNGNPFPGQQFGFQFDGLGNRLETTTNGRTATYEPNSLNQYEERTVPPFRDVRGKAHPAATVSIDGEKADRTLDGQYHQAVPIDNTTGPAHAEISILGVRNHAGPEGEDVTDTQTGSFFLPENPEAFTHDLDGNLTSDGRWTYEWNAENQLAAMETRPDLPATLERQRLEFTYDHAGRRIRKQVFQWDGTEFTPSSDTWFLYHGWKLLAEGTIQNSEFSIQNSHLWGHDLTGTFEGAGTVGGLLATTTHGSEGSTWFMAFDGNGNIAAAVNAEIGATEARFHYGPFGEILTAQGPAADQLPHRFSTKYTDPETGLLYYGFRYLNPETGRWPSRDPIEEEGGINLYGFVGNNGVNGIDILGLFIDICIPWPGIRDVVDEFLFWDVSDWEEISGTINKLFGRAKVPNFGRNLRIFQQRRVKVVRRREYWVSREWCCECDGFDYFTPPSISCGVREKSRTLVAGPKYIRDIGSGQIRSMYSVVGLTNIVTEWENMFR